MADQEKSEAASPKRRQEAREKGNLPRSVDLSSSVVLVVAGYVLLARWEPLVSTLKAVMTTCFQDAAHVVITPSWLIGISKDLGQFVLVALAPLLGAIVLTALITGVAQSGLPTSLKPLVPDFTRLNPLSGLQKLFSSKGVIELIKALLKVLLLGWVTWNFVRGLLSTPSAMLSPDTGALMGYMVEQLWSISKKLIFIMLVIGIADFAYQRFNYEKSLRMTTQELKEEMKETEGNPQIKSRIRQKMRQLAQRRMMQEVPTANVIVTNPTHYAIALKYEMGMAAPRVVAKGMDLVALRIREIADRHHVPIVSNPPLARALYKACDLDDEIPGDLYQAVAEVLAYIHRLKHGVPRIQK